MARLCVRILANDHPTDAKLTTMRTQIGDVICIVPDDHQFSKIEMECGSYRIIDVPGIPEDDLVHLCEHLENAEGIMVQRYVRGLDPECDLQLQQLTPDIISKSMFRDCAKKALDQACVKGDKATIAEKMQEVEILKADPDLRAYVDSVLAKVDAATIEKKDAHDVSQLGAFTL